MLINHIFKDMKKELRIPATLKILLLFAGVIAALYLYDVPIQRIKAERAVNEYMTMQGVDEENIESKRVIKDWKTNGHSIFITFTDDPDKIYRYNYKKTGKIVLLVNDTKYGLPIDNPRYLKYPPLQNIQ